MEDRFVYADNAATTPIDPRVLEKMMPFLTSEYGNASTLYSLGHSSHEAMEEARKEVAHLFEKNLTFSINGKPGVNKQKSYDKFAAFIDVGDSTADEQSSNSANE